MMRIPFFLIIFLVAGCNDNGSKSNRNSTIDSAANSPSVDRVNKEPDTAVGRTDSTIISPKPYYNARFKDVTVEKIGEHKFKIKGKGQIFEASFNWVVEDGHEELKSGFEMTDAGAPEWGNFDFTVDVAKKRANSKLHLVLFESSAKDGSRQHELPVFLY